MIRRRQKSCKEGVCSIQCFPHTRRCCACFSNYVHTSRTQGYLYSGVCTFGALQPTANFKNWRGTYFRRGTYLRGFTVWGKEGIGCLYFLCVYAVQVLLEWTWGCGNPWVKDVTLRSCDVCVNNHFCSNHGWKIFFCVFCQSFTPNRCCFSLPFLLFLSPFSFLLSFFHLTFRLRDNAFDVSTAWCSEIGSLFGSLKLVLWPQKTNFTAPGCISGVSSTMGKKMVPATSVCIKSNHCSYQVISNHQSSHIGPVFVCSQYRCAVAWFFDVAWRYKVYAYWSGLSFVQGSRR